MPKFISDQEMMALEGGGKKKIISDSDMRALEAQSKPSAVDAAIQGFGQGATLGYANELQAAAGGLVPNPTAALDRDLESQGFTIKQGPDTYESRLAENKARDKQLQESGAYTAGELASALIPGAAATKGISLLGKGTRLAKALAPATSVAGKGLQATAFGAAEGGLQNPEYSGMSRGAGALGGGLLSGAGQTVIGGLGSLVRRGKGLAEEEAFKALGGTPKEYREAGKDVNAIGRMLIDEKIVRPGDTFTSIGEKAKGLKKTAESGLNQTYQAIDDAGEGAFNSGNLVADMVSRAKVAAKGQSGGNAAMAKLEEVLREIIPEGGNLSASDVRAIKSQIGKHAEWDKTLSSVDAETKSKVMKQVYDVLDNKISERAGATSGKVAGDLAAGNKRVSQLIDVSDITKGSASREAARNSIPLTDALIGAGGAGAGLAYGLASGDPEKAVANMAIGGSLGLGSKALRKYGRPFTVAALDKIGDAAPAAKVGDNPYLTSAAINALIRQLTGGGQ